LQRVVCHDRQLAQYLPHCQANNLQTAVLHVCEWAYQTAEKEVHNDLLTLKERLAQATKFFVDLQKTLAYLPATCVHGDFWSGNIACSKDNVSIIDWGDAIWGVGSASIVNLLSSAKDQLSSHAEQIWQAYARGWEKDLSEEFIRGSRVASLICSLVVDVEIAKYCKGTLEILPDLMPLLKTLVSLCKR
jgi:aminoglycoside/choline kinase family phosphotransferase